ncbi:AraC family transcriptional regulator [Brevibacillus sp. HB1.2]|uniref:GyrI-like domain-containing protein n=1 Tax=Brevibacillus sp. HB1.2 TaxID=2738807 RepID=UPI00157749D0|nr:GyrI-like domain-containing protein [Brevibacillus sp. HB1.2]NTU20332.1 AraC family transcriptional regulator [Brevibacillus sp. HB1.2]
MEPTVLSREETHVIGFTFTANVTEDLEQKHSASTTEALRARKSEIHNQVGKGEYLIQIYPDKDDFDAAVDPFTTLIGVAVSSLADIPEGMVSHMIPAGTFAKVTHKGPETNLGETYDFLYGSWLSESGYDYAGFDFEYWDERYKPEQEDNEIDIYVPLFK